jgi:hypothetical protein
LEIECVEASLAGRLDDDETGVCQHAEMLRDRRPADTKVPRDFVDPARTADETTQNGTTRCNAKCIELLSELT